MAGLSSSEISVQPVLLSWSSWVWSLPQDTVQAYAQSSTSKAHQKARRFWFHLVSCFHLPIFPPKNMHIVFMFAGVRKLCIAFLGAPGKNGPASRPFVPRKTVHSPGELQGPVQRISRSSCSKWLPWLTNWLLRMVDPAINHPTYIVGHQK